jgi:hypothetical protein
VTAPGCSMTMAGCSAMMALFTLPAMGASAMAVVGPGAPGWAALKRRLPLAGSAVASERAAARSAAAAAAATSPAPYRSTTSILSQFGVHRGRLP